jgi:hypothetical protein
MPFSECGGGSRYLLARALQLWTAARAAPDGARKRKRKEEKKRGHTTSGI